MRSTHLFGDELTNTSGLAMLKQKSLFDAEYVHFTGFRSWKKGTVFPKWNVFISLPSSRSTDCATTLAVHSPV